MDFVEKVRAGDIRSIARAISMVEDDGHEAIDILRGLYPHTGKASVIGVTGSPGAGKSSLVDRLVAAYRSAGCKVGVIAVDPSSAYSGGAILGDRVRMQGHSMDRQVFIRSMATRGYMGGLARATSDTVDLLDAAGYDPVILETVGVGQDEIDVVKAADVVCVVLVPGMGDDIQAIKAGILEIADLFVVNKADMQGTDRLVAELRYMISLADDGDRARPGIYKTVAVRNEGIDLLKDGIESFKERERPRQDRARMKERAADRFRNVLGERLLNNVLDLIGREDLVESLIERIADRELDPYTAAEQVLARVEVK